MIKRSIGHIAVSLFLALAASIAAASTPLDTYRDSAQAFSDGFSARDTSAFERALFTQKTLDKVFAGLGIEPEWERSFREQAAHFLAEKLGSQMLEGIPDNGYAKLLRVWLEGDGGRALIRIDMGDYGNAYLELHMLLDDTETVRVVDWYDYARGQHMSTSLRQMVAMVAPSESALGKLFDLAIDKEADLESIRALGSLYREQRHKEMVDRFLTMDEEYQRSKALATFALATSSKLGERQLYQRVLESIAPYFVGDDSMALLLLDYYFVKGDYRQVVALTEQLEREFGVEDAGLLVLRANVRIKQGHYRLALKHAARAVALEPENEYGYVSLFQAQVAVEDYAAAVETAEKLEQLFQYNMGPDSLGSDAMYTGFVASPAYRQWRADN